MARLADALCGKLRRYLAGEELRDVLDARGYRAVRGGFECGDHLTRVDPLGYGRDRSKVPQAISR